MDSSLRHSMLRYYDERATEYEEAYLLGTGTASIPNSQVFRAEASLLGDIVERFGNGRMIDLACGTAYWLPRYVGGCSAVTLFDQSPRMLDECQTKVSTLGVGDRCTLICGDFFDYEFGSVEYDSALLGFFLSHVTEKQERLVFEALKRMLGTTGRFLILDSAWSLERARFNAKVERQQRQLNDGTRFDIYKRYFDQQDISQWETKYDMSATIEHFGTAFLAVSGKFTDGISSSESEASGA